ncbi:MAG TPA: hypothetical protein GX526_06375 [Thermoanaerobacterales bacterium]|nr:hypothetical protein [Thermoanaerobacterales bacterium]
MFTGKELSIIEKALNGYRKDLENLYEAIKSISVNDKGVAREIAQIRELDSKIIEMKEGGLNG